MIRNRLNLGFLTGMALLAMMSFWLNQKVQPEQPKTDGSSRHDPDYIVENFTATRLDLNGMPQHTLVATKMTHYPDDDSTHLDSPHFTRFSPGKPPMHIQSDRGLISKDGEHAYFIGNVLVTREAYQDKSTLTLTTSYLHVIPDKDQALTDKFVTIRDARINVTGVGLELDNKTQVIKLLSHVKGRYEKPKH